MKPNTHYFIENDTKSMFGIRVFIAGVVTFAAIVKRPENTIIEIPKNGVAGYDLYCEADWWKQTTVRREFFINLLSRIT